MTVGSPPEITVLAGALPSNDLQSRSLLWLFVTGRLAAINERFNLQFRAEIFNLFNRVQFSYPNTVCCSDTNVSFGVVSGQNDQPRIFQFALRLVYWSFQPEGER